MKNIKKILITVMLVAVMVVSVVALAGCGSNVTPVSIALEGYETESFGFCVKEGNTALKDKLNEFIGQDTFADNFAKSKAFHSLEDKTGADKLTLPNLEDNTGVTYTMVTEAGYAPYEYVTTAEYAYKGYAGADVEMMVLFAEFMNAKLEIKDISFDTIPQEVNKNALYIGAAAMTISTEKELVIDFTVAYEGSKQFVLSSDKNNYSNLEQLKGLKIGVQTGTSAHGLLEKAMKGEGILVGTKTKVNSYTKIVPAFEDLKKGKLDAIIIDEAVALRLIKSLGK